MNPYKAFHVSRPCCVRYIRGCWLSDVLAQKCSVCLAGMANDVLCNKAQEAIRIIGAQLDGIELRVRRLVIYVSNTMKRNTENCIRIVLYVFIINQRPRCRPTHWLHSVMTVSIRQNSGG